MAAATATGTFDLQKMGSFRVKGLCLYMQPTGKHSDQKRLEAMFETAYALAEELDAILLDDKRQLLTSETRTDYYHGLNIHDMEEEFA